MVGVVTSLLRAGGDFQGRDGERYAINCPLLSPFPSCLVRRVPMAGYHFAPGVDGALSGYVSGLLWSLVVGHIPWVGPLRARVGSCLSFRCPGDCAATPQGCHLSCRFIVDDYVDNVKSWNRA